MLTKAQEKRLARQGIEPLIYFSNGNVRCGTANGLRTYTLEDLQQISKPGFGDRLTAWIGKNKS